MPVLLAAERFGRDRVDRDTSAAVACLTTGVVDIARTHPHDDVPEPDERRAKTPRDWRCVGALRRKGVSQGEALLLSEELLEALPESVQRYLTTAVIGRPFVRPAAL